MTQDPFTKRTWLVLIVDDEPEVREFLQRTLERNNPAIRTITAENGSEGLQRLAEHPVDLILSDHRMPIMEGTEFLARASQLAPEIPRILLTGFADVDIALQAVNEGHVSALLQKPTSAEEISKAALRLLVTRTAASQRDLAFARGMELARQRAAPVSGSSHGDPP